MSDLPLDGIRILELGGYVAAPYATSLLGTLGAEVVKVERPDGGDNDHRGPTRRWRFDGRRPGWSRSTPLVGQHPREIVGEVYDDEQVEQLIRTGVLLGATTDAS